MIEITKGETFKNRSYKYLSHLFEGSPQWVKSYICEQTSQGKLANVAGYFRGDIQYTEATGDDTSHLLFVLVDTYGEYIEKLNRYKDISKARETFKQFYKNFKKNKGSHNHYDYVYGDLHNSQYHVFVFNMSQWAKTIDAFDEGLYSKMFNDAELKTLKIYKTINGKPNTLWLTFKADKTARELFKKRVAAEFGVSESYVSELENELDIKPLKRMEILNSKLVQKN
jgi:hypothetical protein